MATFETLILDVSGPVATITLNRPDKLNSISVKLREEFLDALDMLNPGDSIRVIRLKGAGRAFTSGYDLAGGYPMLSAQNALSPDGDDEISQIGESRIAKDRVKGRQAAEWLRTIRHFRKPIVAQVHGYCLAGGLDLIGVCDSVFAASDAQIGHPASRGLGLPASLGLLPIKAGPLKTKEMLFTGDTISGAEAERWQIINRALPPDDLDDYVSRFCKRIALLPLDMLSIHKDIVNRWIDNMGYGASVDATTDLGSIAHESPFNAEFRRRVSEGTLRDALTWLNGRFDDPAVTLTDFHKPPE